VTVETPCINTVPLASVVPFRTVVAPEMVKLTDDIGQLSVAIGAILLTIALQTVEGGVIVPTTEILRGHIIFGFSLSTTVKVKIQGVLVLPQASRAMQEMVFIPFGNWVCGVIIVELVGVIKEHIIVGV
jgi:hypothetical protein